MRILQCKLTTIEARPDTEAQRSASQSKGIAKIRLA